MQKVLEDLKYSDEPRKSPRNSFNQSAGVFKNTRKRKGHFKIKASASNHKRFEVKKLSSSGSSPSP